MEGKAGRIRDAKLMGLETGDMSIYGTSAQESSAVEPCGLHNSTNRGQRHVAIFCTKQAQDHTHSWIKTKKQLLNNNKKYNNPPQCRHSHIVLSGIPHIQLSEPRISFFYSILKMCITDFITLLHP